MDEQKPTVGRIVHYVSRGSADGEFKSQCRAAIVTEVVALPGVDGMTPWRCSLAVLNPTGLFFDVNCPQDQRDFAPHDVSDGRSGGTWHWPERV